MNPPPPALSALVFAGGAARRMGGDKALAEWGGTTLLAASLALAAQVADETLLLAGQRNLPPALWPQLRRIPDDPDPAPRSAPAGTGGPLFALAAGLHAARHDWCLTLACDMPYVRAELLRHLVATAAATGADAVLLCTPDGLQPFPGIFHRRSLAPARECLQDGHRALHALFDRLAVHAVAPADVAHIDPGLQSLRNLNTPDELHAARILAAQGAP